MYTNPFTIAYPSGELTVEIHNYFAKATIPYIHKLFKLAQQHCSDSDRIVLLGRLTQAKDYWTKYYSSNRNSWGNQDWAPTTKVQLKHLLEKFDKIISILQKETWGCKKD